MSELPSSVPIVRSDFHCPVNITEGNSLLDSDNQPKFNGGNTWPYYLANSDNQANADVPLGTVKAEIDSRSSRYPEGTRQAAGRIRSCQAAGAGFSGEGLCQIRP